MKEFMAYLENKIAEGKADIAALEADGRGDDANFEEKDKKEEQPEIRYSMRDIQPPHKIKAQLDRFRTGWSEALEKAKQHDDINAVAVEETKLAALEDIAARFREVTGI